MARAGAQAAAEEAAILMFCDPARTVLGPRLGAYPNPLWTGNASRPEALPLGSSRPAGLGTGGVPCIKGCTGWTTIP